MANVFLTGNPGQSTDQPGGPSIPAIPSPDGTAQGMADTVGALVHAVRQLSGHNAAANSSGLGVKAKKGKGLSQKGDPKPKDGTEGRWTELSRTTQDVKIFNPNDSSQFVVVRQITRLVMQDNVTREQWIWVL